MRRNHNTEVLLHN